MLTYEKAFIPTWRLPLLYDIIFDIIKWVMISPLQRNKMYMMSLTGFHDNLF